MPFGFGRKDKNDPVESEDLAPLSWSAPPAPHVTEPRVAPWSTSGLIRLDAAGDIVVSVSSVADARLASKDVRLRKRELGVEKKAVTQQMAAMRADYRTSIANRGPSMRGGGNLGKFVRGMDQINRANARSSQANALQPYEVQKQVIDRQIVSLDTLLNQLDGYIIQQQSR